MEEESLSKQADASQGVPPAMQGQQQLKLHELRPETYNGMVRLIKPGCRTIVLLVDNESRKKLVVKFHKTVWPYRK
jgi:DnaJ family protein C protein 16